MKHVFIINAHTPYLTSLGIINLKKIPKQDIIFILGRNYNCFNIDSSIKTYDLSSIYDIRLTLWNKKKVLERLSEVKQFIDLSITEDFIVYLPHLYYYFFQVFAQHNKCKEIKLIEEGIVDFCKDEKIPEKLSFKSKFINLYFFRNTPFWNANRWNTYFKLENKRISETFAISDKLYRDIPCKHTVVQWPYIEIPNKYKTNATYFVFESAVEQNTIDFHTYLNACERLISKYAQKYNYVKFHPYQTKEHREEILNIFKNKGSEVEQLGDDIPFEMILCNMKGLRVCGFTTSLIYYAALMGHDAHICAKYLLSSNLFMQYWKRYEKSLSAYGDIFKYE
jgi:hypothetical protein